MSLKSIVSDKDLPWQDVAVDENVVTEETGFFGLEVLDGSAVDVLNEGGVWKLKSKKTAGRSSPKPITPHDEPGASSDGTGEPPPPAKTAERGNKRKKAADRRKAKRKEKKRKRKMAKDSEKLVRDREELEREERLEPGAETFSPDTDPWCRLGLGESVALRLQRLNFSRPTPIQTACIPKAIRDRRDILAAAKTGSGKTLAFGLPIMHMIAQHKLRKKNQGDDDSKSLLSLILTPTRELALQIQEHLLPCAKVMDVTIAAIVGGISEQKQKRFLSNRPDIVVATPGRLWNLLSMGNEYLSKLHLLRFLVLDEADKMVERGHYEELDSIVQKIINPPSIENLDDEEVQDNKLVEKRRKEHLRMTKRQTLRFSATLAIGVKGRMTSQKRKRKKKRRDNNEQASDDKSKSVELQKLMERVGLRGKPYVVDFTIDSALASASAGAAKPQNNKLARGSSGGGGGASKPRLPDGLELRRVECTVEQKDVYLYSFCKQQTGKILVFANTIAVVRRIVELLKILRVNVYPIHAQMQQRQRMKNLDRFRSSKDVVLVATDVAARGIDVKGIDFVLHYNVPRNAESFIHRSGRTARANSCGTSIVFSSPLAHEVQNLGRILHVLGLELHDMEDVGIKMATIKRATTRVKLARQIMQKDAKVKQSKSKENWLLKQAEAMDMIVDEALLESSRRNGSRTDGEERIYARLKYQLNDLLERETL
jgi:ATP-dependent RNA helicase DDX24/MAK5